MNRDQMNAAFGVTDEQLDSLAADYEAGDWKGRLGPAVQGRPRLYEEEMRTISFRIPASRLQAIDAHAERNGKSRSEFLRQAIDDALLAG
ncbi:ribbon-helix-helix domain-containing protein [Actinomyces oris]